MSITEEHNGKFNASDWFSYFQENARQRQSIIQVQDIRVEPHLRLPLIRSLQRFQVGERGEGFHLRKVAARTDDPAYCAAIDLFIKEEQEHSRLLARVIEGLEGSLLQHHWSDACFILLRRVLGLKMELLVLLIAEIIAQVYYKVLHDGTTNTVLRAVFTQILHDEDGHVAFHCAYLRQAFAMLHPLMRWQLARSWKLLFMLVCLVVIFDHRTVLYASGVTPRSFWHACMGAFQVARTAIHL